MSRGDVPGRDRADAGSLHTCAGFGSCAETFPGTGSLPTPVAQTLDTAGGGFVGIRDDGMVDEWNASAQSLLGWAAEDVIGRPFVDTIVAPQYREEIGSRLRSLACEHQAAPTQVPVDVRALHQDGRQASVEVLIGRLRWAGSLRWYALLRDVTEREATAQRLASLEEENQLLAGTCALISKHDATGRFLYASSGSSELLGMAPEELVGRSGLELIHPDDRAELTGALRERNPNVELTYRLRHRDGHWVWVEAGWSLVQDSTGAVVEACVSTRDVTDRRLREAEIQEDSKLESLGRLSAGLAHEINSPIQFVGDNARFLAESYHELLTLVATYRHLVDTATPVSWAERIAMVREAEAGVDFEFLEVEIPSAVEQTLEGIERVATIVRAMKTFSHPGHAEQVHADLNEALAATLTVTRHQVTSVADLQADLGTLPPVRCDIAKLNQVFLNLVINAADAIEETGERGTIRVETSSTGEHVMISISDTGGGIPDAVRPKIFDPFFTTKAVGRGTGQGLPLVRTVVQEGHGGTLTLETEQGVGSTFTITLPVEGIVVPGGP